MAKDEGMIGRRFGRLQVLRQAKPHFWLCRCDCGKTVILRESLLTNRFLTSCGCARGDSRKKDITGMRSGMVEALEPSGKKRRGVILWNCRCDCGKEFQTEGYKISGGVITSCGCARNLHQIKDLTGQKFGRLTALQRLDKRKGSSFAWLCRCDCGKIAEVSANALLQGTVQSCGCQKTDRLKQSAKDITGKAFGRLVALEPTEKRMGGSVVWRCRCSCGRETMAAYSSLISENTKSCGCMRKEHESPNAYMHYIDGTCVEMLTQKKLRKDNTSGYTGVVACRGRWRAQITFKGKTYLLGTYSRIEDAAAARKEAEERIFGEFLEWYYETHPETKKSVPKKET